MKKLMISIILVLVSCDSDEPIEPPVTTTTTTSIAPIENPKCDKIMYPEGQRGGFLWKPESESSGNLAVVLPGNFTYKFDSCEVTLKSKEKEKLRWAGFTNWDGLHGNKPFQTWRGSRPGRDYMWGGFVKCVGEGQECYWKIENPAIRND